MLYLRVTSNDHESITVSVCFSSSPTPEPKILDEICLALSHGGLPELKLLYPDCAMVISALEKILSLGDVGTDYFREKFWTTDAGHGRIITVRFRQPIVT